MIDNKTAFYVDEPESPESEPIGLQRSISLPLLLFYGLGTILGAGIYVLVGQVAGLAGHSAPLSFLIAAVVAGFTGFSYAELSARYPLSAGEAVYVQEAFGLPIWAVLVGLAVATSGIVSTADKPTGISNAVTGSGSTSLIQSTAASTPTASAPAIGLPWGKRSQ